MGIRLTAILARYISNIPLTGIIGLALTLAAAYILRRRQREVLGGGGVHQEEVAGGEQAGARGQKSLPHEDEVNVRNKINLASSSVDWVAKRLKGVSRVTVSVLGLLVEEKCAEELVMQGATPVPAGIAVVKDMIMCKRDVYLICHAQDDVGEAVVLGALEHHGLIGESEHQVPVHRVIFCSSQLSIVSIVRQLEPHMHVDGDKKIVQELSRFLNAQHLSSMQDFLLV
eukprot:jgi/Picsp_1/1756/NSC_05228-R1_protein